MTNKDNRPQVNADVPTQRSKSRLVSFDPCEEFVVEVLLTEVAEFTDHPITDLPTLSDRIDPEALVNPRANNKPQESNATVSFEYAGLYVYIEADGTLQLHPQREGSE